MKYAKDHDAYFICEATVNQVNQFGGYTGMRPKDYAELVSGIAADIGFPIEKVILSGDHLGPFVWQHLDAATAMEYSKELVREYVAAGFRKIHLDPTMPLADDDLSAFGNVSSRREPPNWPSFPRKPMKRRKAIPPGLTVRPM